MKLNPLNANPEKWSNTLKQIVGKLPTICLSVFDHFMNLALKGLSRSCKNTNVCMIKVFPLCIFLFPLFKYSANSLLSRFSFKPSFPNSS